VETLDFDGRKAYVRSVDCDYYTTAISHTRVTILDCFEADAPEIANHGEVHVVSRVVGFKKIRFYTNENVGAGELDLPEQQMHTTSYWLNVPLELLAALPYAADDRRDGIFGLAFAMKQVATLVLMCDGHDLGLSINAGDEARHPGAVSSTSSGLRGGLGTGNSDAPRIFIYDAYPGGIGFSQPLFAMHADVLSRTRALIAGCGCDNGCPSCVGPVGETGPLAKTVALRILDHLVGGEVSSSVQRAAASSHIEEAPF
jgi:DEAD/DEAH box helicase domain-containing protein